MNNDDFTNMGQTQRTVRPQEMQRTSRPQQLERTSRPQDQTPQQPMMQQAVKQAAGKKCPYCGAINEPEALFCAQCGQPISTTSCPHCGAEIDPDADFCEACHHYIRKDVCSYCGARLSGNEAYCPECGSPRGGLVCPTCHTLNDFAFCKKCGTALTEEAKTMVKQLQLNPDYQELLEIVRDYSQLENALPYNSDRDILKEQACQKLRERVLTLLAKRRGRGTSHYQASRVEAYDQGGVGRDESREAEDAILHLGQTCRSSDTVACKGPQLCDGQQACRCQIGMGVQL